MLLDARGEREFAAGRIPARRGFTPDGCVSRSSESLETAPWSCTVRVVHAAPPRASCARKDLPTSSSWTAGMRRGSRIAPEPWGSDDRQLHRLSEWACGRHWAGVAGRARVPPSEKPRARSKKSPIRSNRGFAVAGFRSPTGGLNQQAFVQARAAQCFSSSSRGTALSPARSSARRCGSCLGLWPRARPSPRRVGVRPACPAVEFPPNPR
jgi:hypothetical protein